MELKDCIDDVRGQAVAIQGALREVQAIAKQTDLLALNAGAQSPTEAAQPVIVRLQGLCKNEPEAATATALTASETPAGA